MLSALVNRKRLVAIGSALAAALGAGVIWLAGPADAGRSSSPAPDTPYSRFMGFNDPERASERRAAQEARDREPDPEYDRLWEEVESSRDELYVRLAADPRAKRLQDRWRACMANAGHSVDSPQAIDSDDDSALEASAACTAPLADEEKALIEEYETRWVHDNAELLRRAEQRSRGK